MFVKQIQNFIENFDNSNTSEENDISNFSCSEVDDDYSDEEMPETVFFKC
jgi:hypothetical protein